MKSFKDYTDLKSQMEKNLAVIELLYEIRDRLPEPKKAPTGKKVKELKKGLKKIAKPTPRKRKIL